MTGRNGRNVSNSNVNKLLATARRAVAESRAREENLKAALEKALAEKADLEKASSDSLRKEKSELESSLREEKAALERSLQTEKAALERSLQTEKVELESSLNDALDKCKTLQVKVDSLERKYASECRSRILSEKALHKLKKKAEEEKQKEAKEEEEEKGTIIFGMEKVTSRTVDTSAITKNQKIIKKNKPARAKIRFGF